MGPDTQSPGTDVEAADPPPEWLVRLANPVLSRLLRSRLHWLVSRELLLLTVTGRRTGTEYTFPVGYEREGEVLRVVSFGTGWWKNLRDGGAEVVVHLRGERRTGHAEVTERNRPVAAYLREYLRRNGTGDANRVGLKLSDDGVPSQTALEAAVDHVVLVTIDLEAG